MGRKSISILMDGGSTHNFMDPNTAQGLGCKPKNIPPMTVTVANGSQLMCKSQCKEFTWVMNKVNYKGSVYILPLGGCDMVLGVQWLEQLGPVTFDYKDLTMDFVYQGKAMQLQGKQKLGIPSLKLVIVDSLANQFKGQEHSFVVLIYSISMEEQGANPVPKVMTEQQCYQMEGSRII